MSSREHPSRKATQAHPIPVPITRGSPAGGATMQKDGPWTSRHQDIEKMLANLGPKRNKNGRGCPSFDKHRDESGGDRPMSVASAKFAHQRPKMAQICPTASQSGPSLLENCPNLANIGPNSAVSGKKRQCCSKKGQYRLKHGRQVGKHGRCWSNTWGRHVGPNVSNIGPKIDRFRP